MVLVLKGAEMRNRPNAQGHRYSVLPKVSGPKPWDFPVGSVQSRAAARAVVIALAEQMRNEIEAEFGKDSPQVLLVMKDLKSALARSYVVRLLRVAREKAKIYEFDFTLPPVEEVRRNLARLGESNG
jgi:hypothetical protein